MALTSGLGAVPTLSKEQIRIDTVTLTTVVRASSLLSAGSSMRRTVGDTDSAEKLMSRLNRMEPLTRGSTRASTGVR